MTPYVNSVDIKKYNLYRVGNLKGVLLFSFIALLGLSAASDKDKKENEDSEDKTSDDERIFWGLLGVCSLLVAIANMFAKDYAGSKSEEVPGSTVPIEDVKASDQTIIINKPNSEKIIKIITNRNGEFSAEKLNPLFTDKIYFENENVFIELKYPNGERQSLPVPVKYVFPPYIEITKSVDNIREQPDIESRIITKCHQGEYYPVLDIYTPYKKIYPWYKIKTNQGDYWTHSSNGRLLYGPKELLSRPCDLISDFVFSDANSIVPNNAIDADENSCISATIKNNGPGPAFNVTLVPESNNPDIVFEQSNYNIGDLNQSESANLNIVLKSGEYIEDGKAHITIDTKENRGYNAQQKTLEIATKRFRKSDLEISEIYINDSQSGYADGNGNSILETGEIAEINIRLYNKGDGSFLGKDCNLNVPSGVNITCLKKSIEKIDPYSSELLKYKISLPSKYNYDDLHFSIMLENTRPDEIVELKGSVPTGSIFPNISMSIDCYGEFSNGLSFPVTISMINTGNADAKDIYFPIIPSDGVTISPNIIKIEKLYKNSYQHIAAEVEIDRNYRESEIEFYGAVDCSNFDPMKVYRSYPVTIKKPDLQIAFYLPQGGNALLLGTDFRIAISTLNLGDLDALDVELKTSTTSNLYKPHFTIKIGNLPPMKQYTEIINFPIIPRGIDQKKLKIDFLISQKDFARVDTSVFIPLVSETSEIIRIVQKDDMPSLGPMDIGFLKTYSDTIKGIIAEGSCLLGENLNRNQAKNRALLDARRNLVESVVVKITSQTRIQGYQLLSTQARQNVSCNIFNSEILDDVLEESAEGYRCRVKIRGDVLRSVKVR